MRYAFQKLKNTDGTPVTETSFWGDHAPESYETTLENAWHYPEGEVKNKLRQLKAYGTFKKIPIPE